MEKYLAALLFCLSSIAYAEGILTTVPVLCTSMDELAVTLDRFEEVPILTSLSYRNSPDGNAYEFASVIFANIKTGTYTIVEEVNSMYCIVSVGENLKPYVDQDKSLDNKGT